MEAQKDLYFRPESNKLILKPSNRSVNFTKNNFATHILKLGDSSENNKMNITSQKNNANYENNENNNENNKDTFVSPKKHINFFLKSGKSDSFQTSPLSFYGSFKNVKSNIRKDSINFDILENEKQNSYTNKKSNSLKNNDSPLKRMKTTNEQNLISHRPSAFLPKNKRYSNSKISNGYRNSKKLNLYLNTNKDNNLLKSEGDGNTIKTNILTDRNKKDSIFNNFSRRNSVKKNIVKNYRKMNTLSYQKFTKNQKLSPKKITKKEIKPVIVNPLLVSEEDKIFDEMKKYLCFKYEQKQLNSKLNEVKKNFNKSKAISSKMKKNKTKNKIQTTDQIKLDYLYLSTTKMNRKIRYIKRNKERQDLAEYQNTLLDAIKPTISDYTYTHLKDKLIEIRLKNSKKYPYNYKRIKEIEIEEEDVINDFNSICEKCLKTFQRAREQKEIVHSNNLKIKLPLLNFISCLKKKKKQIKRKSLATLK